MFESILIGIPIVLGVIQYIRILKRKIGNLNDENQALEKSLEITAEMEVANKLAEEDEQIALEAVNTDSWREELKK